MRLIAMMLVLCSGISFATTKHAPLPDSVYRAKTVYIINQSGFQSTADGAYDALTKWGVFTVVSDKTKADLLLTFTYEGDELVNGTSRWGNFDMVVKLPGTDDTVFTASSGGGGLHMPSARGGVAAKDCVNQFKRRVQEPH
jgi:hypothetical protein